MGSFSRPFASGAGRRVEAGHQTPQGFPAAAEMLAMMYDASLDRIYSRNQSLSVYYNRYIPYYYWDISNNNGKSYAPYFPVKSWRVPVWRFDYFCSPYNGAAEVLQIVENDAALCEPVIMGYGPYGPKWKQDVQLK